MQEDPCRSSLSYPLCTQGEHHHLPSSLRKASLVDPRGILPSAALNLIHLAPCLNILRLPGGLTLGAQESSSTWVPISLGLPQPVLGVQDGDGGGDLGFKYTREVPVMAEAEEEGVLASLRALSKHLHIFVKEEAEGEGGLITLRGNCWGGKTRGQVNLGRALNALFNLASLPSPHQSQHHRPQPLPVQPTEVEVMASPHEHSGSGPVGGEPELGAKKLSSHSLCLRYLYFKGAADVEAVLQACEAGLAVGPTLTPGASNTKVVSPSPIITRRLVLDQCYASLLDWIRTQCLSAPSLPATFSQRGGVQGTEKPGGSFRQYLFWPVVGSGEGYSCSLDANGRGCA